MTQKPEEWVLVPREPTEKMLDGYWHSTGESREMRSRTHARGQRIYADFLAASPSPEGTRGEMRKRIIDVLDKWHDGSRERKADDILAALTLPPVPGVDREVVARLVADAMTWASRHTRDVTFAAGDDMALRTTDAILALVSQQRPKAGGD
jgi:hypothetical protein